jgi:hypothetical protein
MADGKQAKQAKEGKQPKPKPKSSSTASSAPRPDEKKRSDSSTQTQQKSPAVEKKTATKKAKPKNKSAKNADGDQALSTDSEPPRTNRSQKENQAKRKEALSMNTKREKLSWVDLFDMTRFSKVRNRVPPLASIGAPDLSNKDTVCSFLCSTTESQANSANKILMWTLYWLKDQCATCGVLAANDAKSAPSKSDWNFDLPAGLLVRDHFGVNLPLLLDAKSGLLKPVGIPADNVAVIRECVGVRLDQESGNSLRQFADSVVGVTKSAMVYNSKQCDVKEKLIPNYAPQAAPWRLLQRVVLVDNELGFFGEYTASKDKKQSQEQIRSQDWMVKHVHSISGIMRYGLSGVLGVVAKLSAKKKKTAYGFLVLTHQKPRRIPLPDGKTLRYAFDSPVMLFVTWADADPQFEKMFTTVFTPKPTERTDLEIVNSPSGQLRFMGRNPRFADLFSTFSVDGNGVTESPKNTSSLFTTMSNLKKNCERLSRVGACPKK